MEFEKIVQDKLAKRPTRRELLLTTLGLIATPLLVSCSHESQKPHTSSPPIDAEPTQAAPTVIIERTPSPFDAPLTGEIAEADADIRFLRGNRNIQIAEERLVQTGGQLVIVKVGLHKAQVQIPSLFSRYQPILNDRTLRDAGYPQRYPLEHKFQAYTRENIDGAEVSVQWVTSFYGGDGPQATSMNASDVRFLAIGRSDEGYQPYMSLTPIAPIAPQLVRLR